MTDNEKNLVIIKALYNWILASSLFRTNGYGFALKPRHVKV